jgi:hypothetical protein
MGSRAPELSKIDAQSKKPLEWSHYVIIFSQIGAQRFWNLGGANKKKNMSSI